MNSNIVNIGKLYLGGGGGAEDSVKLDKRFLNSLKNKKIVYIPIALTPKTGGYESCFDWITSSLTNASDDFIEISMWTDLGQKGINDLESYGGIYIGGGNTYKLLDHIYKTGFNEVLIEFYNRGGLIYGGSAGAIILGKSISIVSEENDANYVYEDGLNLLNGKSVLCHFSKDKNNTVEHFIENTSGDVIALTEKSGLIISNSNSIESVGFEPVTIYTLLDKEEQLNPGDKSKI